MCDGVKELRHILSGSLDCQVLEGLVDPVVDLLLSLLLDSNGESLELSIPVLRLIDQTTDELPEIGMRTAEVSLQSMIVTLHRIIRPSRHLQSKRL